MSSFENRDEEWAADMLESTVDTTDTSQSVRAQSSRRMDKLSLAFAASTAVLVLISYVLIAAEFSFYRFSELLIVWVLLFYSIFFRKRISDAELEVETDQERPELARLRCTHCGAEYMYPESNVDTADYSVECQNCAKRFQVDMWKDIQSY